MDRARHREPSLGDAGEPGLSTGPIIEEAVKDVAAVAPEIAHDSRDLFGILPGDCTRVEILDDRVGGLPIVERRRTGNVCDCVSPGPLGENRRVWR
jgi:hypothetical protein